MHEENEGGQDLDYRSEEDGTEFQGSDAYLYRLDRLPSGRSPKIGETKESQRQTLKNDTMCIDLDADAAQRAKIAEALGVPNVVGGRCSLIRATTNLSRSCQRSWRPARSWTRYTLAACS